MTLEKEIGFNSFRNEWQKAGLAILYTYGLLNNGHENFFKQHGLTSQQYNALRILHDQYPTPVSTSYLREKMLDKMSDASRLVSRLSAKGLVDVKQNATDKRLVNILISEEGLRKFNSIGKEISKMDALMQALTEEEARQLTSLLDKARQSIQSNGEPSTSLEQAQS
ncbi:MarR family winged helix-turn-helix transcriptional regulator [Pontibacter liquoris]|uniref:MarR family winged helix-turn-helix transcriptional regulator n=1 Tax=Pontibacter liquoris TaxID=2905677 RepID=UPI001FA76A3B|nr:MarR family transcriptional regulator [Pontibacter liquoris]